MRNLLIVEDEKMIRQGIHAMVLRAPVNIENVILCKNGEEAYEVLKQEEVDVMITDIRMPKKDGITLVKEIQNLSHVPKVIVISGYDDFNYAVELLRYGAKEYILKPVERDKLSKILVKIEEEIQSEIKQKTEIKKIGRQQFKYLMLTPNPSERDLAILEDEFNKEFEQEEYVVCCSNHRLSLDCKQKGLICLEDIHGQNVYILKKAILAMLLQDELKGHYIGYSKPYQAWNQVIVAYKEALLERKKAFVWGLSLGEDTRYTMKTEIISEDTIEQYVQMIGTNRIDETSKFLTHILYKAKRASIEAEHFEWIMTTMVNKILSNYKNVINLTKEEENELKSIYSFDHAKVYCDKILAWIKSIHEHINTEYNDYKNKQKIQQAVNYIQDNYNQNLNMAVVSNYISMNYSLFSYEFKAFTGMNFVNYLKNLRMNEAKRLLKETELKIMEISQKVGYENEKNFMKSFRNCCGISPSEYRKNVQIASIPQPK